MNIYLKWIDGCKNRTCANQIVFIKVGDWFETFDDQAETASRVCQIPFTSRKISNMSERVRIFGIPYHDVHRTNQLFIDNGYEMFIIPSEETP